MTRPAWFLRFRRPMERSAAIVMSADAAASSVTDDASVGRRRSRRPAQAAPGRRTIVLVALAASWMVARPGAGQLPTEPITLAGGRFVVSSEVSLAIAPADDGWFNYTSYGQGSLRHARLGASSALSLGRRVQLLTELRSETGRPFEVFALFARIRPWSERALDLQVGRIPPTFGTFARRSYGVANPLVGLPLPYQYLTALRPDALPASADDLLRMRTRGWRPSYPLGSREARTGVPLVSAQSWDTGVQTRVGSGAVQLVASVTTGSLANPRVQDDNRGKQLATRVILRPRLGLDLGVSAAHGDFVSRSARQGLDIGRDLSLTQTAVGADVEYAWGHWMLRGEWLHSWWRLPEVDAPRLDRPLRAWGLTVEGRYALRPGLYLAARGDHLGFSSITGTLFDGRPTPWEAPITRLEVGGGYSLTRNLVAKVSYQHNWRESLFEPRTGFVAAQLLYWF